MICWSFYANEQKIWNGVHFCTWQAKQFNSRGQRVLVSWWWEKVNIGNILSCAVWDKAEKDQCETNTCSVHPMVWSSETATAALQRADLLNESCSSHSVFVCVLQSWLWIALTTTHTSGDGFHGTTVLCSEVKRFGMLTHMLCCPLLH